MLKFDESLVRKSKLRKRTAVLRKIPGDDLVSILNVGAVLLIVLVMFSVSMYMDNRTTNREQFCMGIAYSSVPVHIADPDGKCK